MASPSRGSRELTCIRPLDFPSRLRHVGIVVATYPKLPQEPPLAGYTTGGRLVGRRAARDTDQAISQQNVDLIRNLYALGDFLSITPDQVDDVFRDYLDAEFEFHLPPDYPEGEPVFRGREGTLRMIAMLRETWGEWNFTPERFIDAGDRVVVFARIEAEGGASGVPIELETAHVWKIRGGRAVSMHVYRDRSEALEAAGLSE